MPIFLAVLKLPKGTREQGKEAGKIADERKYGLECSLRKVSMELKASLLLIISFCRCLY